MPSSASPKGPYAFPPTMNLAVNPVAIPIASNHKEASRAPSNPQLGTSLGGQN